MRILTVSLGLLALSLLCLTGCGSGSGTSTFDGATGTVRLLVADAPLDGVAAVNVSIDQVDLLTSEHAGGSASQFVTIFTGPVTVNLLEWANRPLNELPVLGEQEIPAGEYVQLRVRLGSEHSVVLDDDTVKPLTVASGQLLMPLNFTMAEGDVEPVVLDFDLSAPGSLHTIPGHATPQECTAFMLTPVLRAFPVRQTGSIVGHLNIPRQLTAQARARLRIRVMDEHGQEVLDASQHPIATGVTVPAGIGRVAIAIHGLPEGTYTLQVIDTTTGQVLVEVPVTVGGGQNPPIPDISVPT